MIRNFSKQLDISTIDATQISMVSVLTAKDMEQVGQRGKSAIVIYGLGKDVHGLCQDPEKALAELASRGVNFLPLGDKNFINPQAVSFFRQMMPDDKTGECDVTVGLRGVRYELKQHMPHEEALALKQKIQETGKDFYVKSVSSYPEPKTVVLPIEVDGKIVMAEGKEQRYTWDFPAQNVMIDPAQAGLIRTDERYLHVAFNDCASLTLDKGHVHLVPGLKESFAAMNPDMDAYDIHMLVQDFYKKKSLEALNATGAELFTKTPQLTRIAGSKHLVCAKPSESIAASAGDDNRLWLCFRETMGNYTGMDYGFWVHFSNDQDRDAALNAFSPQPSAAKPQPKAPVSPRRP